MEVLADALGIELPIGHHAVRAATKTQTTKITKRPAPTPFEFYRKLNFIAQIIFDRKVGGWFFSILRIQVLAPLRYADAVGVSDLWESNTSIVGKAINMKDKEGGVMVWATPTDGALKEKRYGPLLEHWSKVAPIAPCISVPLSPFFFRRTCRSMWSRKARPGPPKRRRPALRKN